MEQGSVTAQRDVLKMSHFQFYISSKRLKLILIYYLFSVAQSVDIVSGKSP